ncbi:MAG: SH3 domain-containing protein [Chloroflexota bacterium]
MLKRCLLLVCFGLLLIPAFAVFAQQPPDTIGVVLADLSKQVGKTIAVTDLDNWSFSGEIFPDTSLGCPQAGKAYAQVQTSGVQFILIYQGVSYDYRVSADKNIIVLCSSTGVTPPCPPPDDVAYLPPRLAVGNQGRVVTTGIPNNIRQQPGSSSQLLGEIPPGATFNVSGGPSCSTLDKIVWWKVDYNGISGWTAEGKDKDYWIEPLTLTGTPIPPPNQPQAITPANAAQVKTLADLQNPKGAAAVSANGQMLALIIDSGVQIIKIDGVSVVTTLTTGVGVQPTSVAFDPLGRFLVIGDNQGNLRTWLIGADGTLSDGVQFVGHSGSVNTLAINAAGTLIASGSTSGAVYLWDVGTGTLLNTLSNLAVPVTFIQFSQNSMVLIASGPQGNVIAWGIPTSAG